MCIQQKLTVGEAWGQGERIRKNIELVNADLWIAVEAEFHSVRRARQQVRITAMSRPPRFPRERETKVVISCPESPPVKTHDT
jgi:hypothetical protein